MSKIISIANQLKNALNNFVDSLDDSFNTEVSAKLRKIYILNNIIFGLREREKNLNRKKNLLKN